MLTPFNAAISFIAGFRGFRGVDTLITFPWKDPQGWLFSPLRGWGFICS